MSGQTVADARTLADKVIAMGVLEATRPPRTQQVHIGALLSDAVLQPGLNYRTVVAPRVNRVVRLFPEAVCLLAFSGILLRHGPNYVLNWKHHEKPRRLTEIVRVLGEESIESAHDLASWLGSETNVAKLLHIRGVGPKTVDYMAILAGADGVAIDRHIESFLEAAGIAPKDYADARRIVCLTADLLGVSRGTLDQALWETCSQVKSNM